MGLKKVTNQGTDEQGNSRSRIDRLLNQFKTSVIISLFIFDICHLSNDTIYIVLLNYIKLTATKLYATKNVFEYTHYLCQILSDIKYQVYSKIKYYQTSTAFNDNVCQILSNIIKYYLHIITMCAKYNQGGRSLPDEITLYTLSECPVIN